MLINTCEVQVYVLKNQPIIVEGNVLETSLSLRDDQDVIKQQNKHITSNAQFVSALDLMPHIVMVINSRRQIVWANQCLLNALKKSSLDECLGLRPGEVFDCLNAINSENGCGTSKQCTKCGALLAILESLEGNGSEQECSIQTVNNETLTLRVTAGSIDIDNEAFSLISMLDISSEKQKRLMERVFFHDTMNIAGAMQGLIGILPETIQNETQQDIDEIQGALKDSATNLLDLIKWQKDLLSAEINELNIYKNEINAHDLLRSIQHLFEKMSVFQGRQIQISCALDNVCFSSDERILRRVLVNAVKNALEAVNEGESVTIGCEENNCDILFSIHNEAYIPEDIQQGIFRKFFSTKSQDRGIGTYSIKLFTEKYLRGKVWFKSDKEEGTTFYIQLPKG